MTPIQVYEAAQAAFHQAVKDHEASEGQLGLAILSREEAERKLAVSIEAERELQANYSDAYRGVLAAKAMLDRAAVLRMEYEKEKEGKTDGGN